MSALGPVLVVDDEPAIRRLLRAAVERGGHAVAEAATAAEALRTVERVRPVWSCSTSACPIGMDWSSSPRSVRRARPSSS